MTVWLIILGVAVLWCILPLWETLFLAGSAPGIYWLFIADDFALKVILVLIGAVALAEAIMVTLLALRAPAETDAAKAARDQMTAACGVGFLALLLLVARLGMAQLNFSPLLDQHMGKVETGQHFYFLAHQASAARGGNQYILAQCGTLGIWCSRLADVPSQPSADAGPGPQAFIEYDGQSHSIKVVELGHTYFTYPLDR